MIAEYCLIAAGVYLLGGFPFVLLGVNQIDPHASRSSWGFRILILPGAMFLWPLLARRWAGGIHQPPEEHNAHRRLARKDTRL
jgi:hypothetical protein